MGWPKGQKRPDAFKKKEDTTCTYAKPKEVVLVPDLPVNMKLSDVINQLKGILQSYRCNIETKIIEESNVTTGVTVTISFLIR